MSELAEYEVIVGEFISAMDAAVYSGTYRGAKCILKFFTGAVEVTEGHIMKLLEPTGVVPKVLLETSVDYYSYDTEEWYYKMIVMEYIASCDLADLIVSPADMVLVRELCIRAVTGYRKIQAAGYVHNDLKLDNLRWDGARIIFIDFGSSYQASWWEEVAGYKFHQADYLSDDFIAEHKRYREFIATTGIKYPPPSYAIEEHITQPGSFYLGRDVECLISKCMLPLLVKTGDLEVIRSLQRYLH